MSFTLQKDQVKLFVLVYGFVWALTLVMVNYTSSGLTLHKIPLNNGKRNSEFLKFPRLTFFWSLFTLMKAFQKLTFLWHQFA
jgi:hypothetical protein